MIRLAKTTLVALAIVAGVISGVDAQVKSVRLDPVNRDIYQFTYVNKGKCDVKVEVFDAVGKILLSERIDRKRSFTKDYSFQKLNFGTYTFKITDGEGVYVTEVNRTEELDMEAAITKIEGEKAKVIVKGELMGPVSINIFDGNDVLVFEDRIERDRSFTRVYDLSRVKAEEMRIEVVKDRVLLAQSVF